MKKNALSLLSVLITSGLLFLSGQPGMAESPEEQVIQIASTQSQPGSKEPEGLETEPSSPFSAGWDITVVSKYLFQGIDYSDGEPVIQPEVILTYKDLSAILWMNYDLHTRDSTEYDLYLQYSREILDFSLTAGYAHYNYPHREGWNPSQEVFIEISHSTLLNPSLSIHYDFDAGKGLYSTLGISHGIETSLGDLSLGMNLFHQNHYYENTGFPSAEFNGSLGYSIGSFTITPSISYFLAWENGDFEGDNSVPDTWLFSINVAQSF